MKVFNHIIIHKTQLTEDQISVNHPSILHKSAPQNPASSREGSASHLRWCKPSSAFQKYHQKVKRVSKIEKKRQKLAQQALEPAENRVSKQNELLIHKSFPLLKLSPLQFGEIASSEKVSQYSQRYSDPNQASLFNYFDVSGPDNDDIEKRSEGANSSQVEDKKDTNKSSSISVDTLPSKREGVRQVSQRRFTDPFIIVRNAGRHRKIKTKPVHKETKKAKVATCEEAYEPTGKFHISQLQRRQAFIDRIEAEKRI